MPDEDVAPGTTFEPAPEPVPEPQVQWAWGADWSAEKADAARREREREQLEAGLEKSRTGFGARLLSAFRSGSQADWDEIEETLITGDVGAALSIDLFERARKRKDVTPEEAVRSELAGLLARRDAEHWEPVPAVEGGPAIVLVVGVNGTGKTTTVAKLAKRRQEVGGRVVLAAADTFRAAAVDQLKVWGERVSSPVIHQREGADPAAVVFDAIAAARSRGFDEVIVDTAGRLHTRANLMKELEKVCKVAEREVAGAPHEVLLVLDATTGSNGIEQAQRFGATAGVNGVVLTKLDGTAKGGVVLAIADTLKLPVRWVGVGEAVDDLLPFNAEEFVDSLLDIER
jgi:fused signal recognition particle receptor